MWAMVMTDTLLEIFWMKWWAHGNFILLAKTTYLVLQTISFTPVVFEIGFIIRHTKFFRFVSLAAAVIYIISNIFFLLTFIGELESPEGWFERNMFTTFTELILGYFTFFDMIGIPVSLAIIIKEFSMEFFQFLKRNAGAKNDNISLGFTDLMFFVKGVIDFFNPVNRYNTTKNFIAKPYYQR